MGKKFCGHLKYWREVDLLSIDPFEQHCLRMTGGGKFSMPKNFN